MVIQNVTGTYNLQVAQNEQYANENIYILCDTTGGPVTINIPAITSYQYLNQNIFVFDASSNAATHNITINLAQATVTGGANQVVISEDGGSRKLEPTSTNSYIVSNAPVGSAQDWATTLGIGNTSGANNAIMSKVGTATSFATQQDSQKIRFQPSLWDGSEVDTKYYDMYVDALTASGAFAAGNEDSVMAIDFDGNRVAGGYYRNASGASYWLVGNFASNINGGAYLSSFGECVVRNPVTDNQLEMRATGGSICEIVTRQEFHFKYVAVVSWRINSSGDVFVGANTVTSLSAKLHVQGDGSGTNLAFLTENSAGANILSAREDGVVLMENLPVASAGLPSGALWNNAGVINIV